MRIFSSATLIMVSLNFVGCNYDAQKELDTAFLNADEIVVTTYFNKEEVKSIKFTYPTEEKEKLRVGILAYKGAGSDCGEASGRMAFVQKKKEILELKFQVSSECKSVWIVDGLTEYHFPIDTSLANLLQSRLEFVKQLKGAVPAES